MNINTNLPRQTAETLHVIFDFDRTLIDHESTHEALKIAIMEHDPNGREAAQLSLIAARLAAGKAGLFDRAALYRAAFRLRKRHVEAYIRQTAPAIDPAIRNLIQRLQRAGAELHILSAGYREAIEPLGHHLGFDSRNIDANRLIWLGARALAVHPSPLHGRAGKAAVIRRARRAGRFAGKVIMIGDSEADYLAYRDGPADGFICADYYRAEPLPLADATIMRVARVGELGQAIDTMRQRFMSGLASNG